MRTHTHTLDVVLLARSPATSKYELSFAVVLLGLDYPSPRSRSSEHKSPRSNGRRRGLLSRESAQRTRTEVLSPRMSTGMGGDIESQDETSASPSKSRRKGDGVGGQHRSNSNGLKKADSDRRRTSSRERTSTSASRTNRSSIRGSSASDPRARSSRRSNGPQESVSISMQTGATGDEGGRRISSGSGNANANGNGNDSQTTVYELEAADAAAASEGPGRRSSSLNTAWQRISRPARHLADKVTKRGATTQSDACLYSSLSPVTPMSDGSTTPLRTSRHSGSRESMPNGALSCSMSPPSYQCTHRLCMAFNTEGQRLYWRTKLLCISCSFSLSLSLSHLPFIPLYLSTHATYLIPSRPLANVISRQSVAHRTYGLSQTGFWISRDGVSLCTTFYRACPSA